VLGQEACSRDGLASTPPSSSFGHGPEGLRRVRLAVAQEPRETGSDERGLVDRRLRALLEVAQLSQRAATRGCRRGSLRAIRIVSSSASALVTAARFAFARQPAASVL
jgi:hypothetical protein